MRSLRLPLRVLAVLFSGMMLAGGLRAADPGTLRVAADHRHLEFTDGRSFFYLGDTAWMLFSRLNREEAARYLANRAAKGFTVIQAVALAPDARLATPNAAGDLPFVDHDPARPNEAYFRHVDAVLKQANDQGLFIGFLPLWGAHWRQDRAKEASRFTVENSRAYGRFVGARYRDSRLIWILGGDRDIALPGERAVIEALAAGLKEGDGGAHLMTYHPRGPGLSSEALHAAPWLDFNMVQSSHGAHDHDNGLFIEHDLQLSPPKPSLDGEPRYEMMPVGFYYSQVSRLDRFDDADVRQAAYWSVFAGACGHTYGNNNVWQMWQPGRTPGLGANQAWYDSLDTPGAFQMGILRRLMESRPFKRLAPAPGMILAASASFGGKVRALCAGDGSFALVYSPRGESFTVDKGFIKAPQVREAWFDPRYGVSYSVHVTETHGIQTYAPPTSGRGQDWVLIIEDASIQAPLPGEAPRRETRPDL